MKEAFVFITLVDITNTSVIRGQSKERDQQRNWESVLQVLSLKTQPYIVEGPLNVEFDKENTGVTSWFGDFYLDQQYPQNLWAIKFTADREEVYSIEQLYQDFDQVPIILGLDEKARFMLPIFHSYGSLKNIHIEKVKELNIN